MADHIQYVLRSSLDVTKASMLFSILKRKIVALIMSPVSLRFGLGYLVQLSMGISFVFQTHLKVQAWTSAPLLYSQSPLKLRGLKNSLYYGMGAYFSKNKSKKSDQADWSPKLWCFGPQSSGTENAYGCILWASRKLPESPYYKGVFNCKYSTKQH